jgi:hypothetical protein
MICWITKSLLSLTVALNHRETMHWLRLGHRQSQKRQNKSTQRKSLLPLPSKHLNKPLGAKFVLDFFGGSGSTLIACEENSRHCRMMELDPAYCDVIVKRWEDFTGNTAVCVPSDQHFTEQQEAF